MKSLHERISAEKAASRRSDWERIARGEATPEEIQRENSLFPDAATYREVNQKQVYAAIEKLLKKRRPRARA